MLSLQSFTDYKSNPCNEVFGVGSHVFELLCQEGSLVTKVWINGADLMSAVNSFAKKESLVCTDKTPLRISNSVRVGGYRVYFSSSDSDMSFSKFDDVIVRKIY